jgi:hypothetical protein
VTRVGEDGPIFSHNSDPYLVGRTLESHCNHPSCNTLHLPCSHQPYPAISYKTAKTNSAREQYERTKSERSSKCDGGIRVRSSIGREGTGVLHFDGYFFLKIRFHFGGYDNLKISMTEHFGSESFSILLRFEWFKML